MTELIQTICAFVIAACALSKYCERRPLALQNARLDVLLLTTGGPIAKDFQEWFEFREQLEGPQLSPRHEKRLLAILHRGTKDQEGQAFCR